ncbi:MAG TPA: protease pro-enzyme activation domain-containing protein [Bryobacteraceae bacterium]|nr:protease pro-enzyme activation domain-containing protein [Bryobacteraceae bacterium]
MRSVTLWATVLWFAHSLWAGEIRIATAIDNNRRTALAGQVSPRIRLGADQGRIDPAFEMPYLMLVLRPSAAQQADLDRLLEQQQDPASPEYHRWLTPEQYADRFGAEQADVDKMLSWLAQQGLTVKSVARGRNAIVFRGAAAQVESAFGTQIHRYLVNGVSHYANATEPSIPAAMSGVVSAIHGLHDFHLHPMARRSLRPRDNLGSSHQLGPDDIATIYDISPLYHAGINGSGQKIVVAGDVEVNLSDIEQYRNNFGLPANDPQTMLVPGNVNPGTCNPSDASCDLDEADLDLELSGSVARDAKILFVYAPNVLDAVQYAIDQNLAPVISLSYGDCELQTSRSDALTFQSWATQANTEGITWFAASGDAGAADCFGGTDPATNNSISVDMPASVPQVTGIGGTEFNEGGGTYWSTVNSATNSSALSYIPEVAWNDSGTDGTPTATGGGLSVYFTKPSWQTGTPADGARDVPDVSISGSADRDGYVIVSGGKLGIIGGTSVGPPQFAGVAALLNQYLVTNGYQSSAGLGNMNPRFYALASTSGVYHDVTQGSNIVTPCSSRRGCTAAPIGYDAGAGYDLTTGIGSVDIHNLVNAWHGSGVRVKAAVTMTAGASVTSLAFAGSTVLSAAVASSDGGTPTGTVTFSVGIFSLGTAPLVVSGGHVTASLTVNGYQFGVGANSVTAVYGGDGSYNGSTATETVTITSAGNGVPAVSSQLNGASFTTALAPGGVLSVFGSNLAPATGAAPATPLPTMMGGTWVTINNVTAPLYYVSPTQLNIQVPYETPTNSAVLLVIHNNGAMTSASMIAQPIAPAIFTFDNNAPVPYTTAARGEEIVLYMTGAGALSPPVADGAAPAANTPLADLPAPVGAVKVTVGGATATLDFVGLPTWAVGVVQINYTIPADAPPGVQPVVVSVGGVESVATQLTVTQ